MPLETVFATHKLISPPTPRKTLGKKTNYMVLQAFNVTITSLHYNSPSDSFTPASNIFPISTLSSAQNTSSVFSLPDDNATVTLTLPRNIKNAVVSIFASGNGDEEFWKVFFILFQFS